eukprot:350381-Chlamydomonas_euryale.AAC.2
MTEPWPAVRRLKRVSCRFLAGAGQRPRAEAANSSRTRLGCRPPTRPATERGRPPGGHAPSHDG